MGAYRLEFMVREDMKLMEIDDARCRVNYNCDFTLPTGLRGAILRRTFGRSFDTGPADSPFAAQTGGGAGLRTLDERLWWITAEGRSALDVLTGSNSSQVSTD